MAKLLLSSILALSLVACAGAASDDDPVIDDDAITAASLVGTFRPAGRAGPGVSDPWNFELVTLHSDKTYVEARHVTSPTVKIRGEFHYAHNSKGRYLVLVPYLHDDGSKTLDQADKTSIRYEIMPNGALKIFGDTRDTVGIVLERTPAQSYCAAPSDCAIQGLAKSCAAAWSCAANTCSSTCAP